MFPCGALFSGVFNEIVIEVPQFHKCHPTLSWKISGCAPALIYYFFSKSHYLNCLTVFWIRLSRYMLSNLYNDLVLCTASDTFRILLAYSVLCFFWYMTAYSSILIVTKHIHAYWDTIKSYSDLFSHIYHPV